MPNQIAIRRPFRKRGQNWLPSTSLLVGSATGSGGVEFGGAATVAFVHAGSVASDIVVQWDFDNDSDFSESVEDITTYVRSLETFTGRDWPSLLTGKAGPGKFKATLDNSDNRFNYFNAASPLVTPPFSLRVGRKLRVKVSGAGDPDPTLLAKDRFRRTMGALGSDETGKTYTEPLANDFTVFANRAVASSEGNEHIAVIDTGSTDYYVQTKISVLNDATRLNRVGVVYRYVDSNDYSLCVVSAADEGFQLIDVVAGVETVISSVQIELYSGVTVGALVVNDVVTAYLEGVPMFSAAAINTSAEFVGMYADWGTGDAMPEIDDFFAWTGIPTQQEGVIWTGDVSELQSSVVAGPEKAAMVAAEGFLARMPSVEVTPPASLDGRKTGLLMGNVLAKSLLLHPPGVVNLGDVTTGVFTMDERSAMAVARDVEETEFGFLYETQEGYVSFLDRSHRDALTSQVTFSDEIGAQFGYTRLEPYDWKKEVFNRILAGVSPWSEGTPATLFSDAGPYTFASGESTMLSATYSGTVVQWTGHTRTVTIPTGVSGMTVITQTATAGTTYNVTMPATVDAGDLLIIMIDGADNPAADTPVGWTLRSGVTGNIYPYVYVKVADGTEDGTTVAFTSTSTNWASHVYRVTQWFGTLDGIEIGGYASDLFQFSQPNAPTWYPSWGEKETLFITFWSGSSTSGSGTAPTGYTNGNHTRSGATSVQVASASRIDTVTNEDAGAWVNAGSVGSWNARTMSIRGGEGSETVVTSSTPAGQEPTFTIGYVDSIGGTTQTHTDIEVTGVPLIEGDQTFAQADDYDSQDDHNGIRTYQASASLFANITDAETYADLVLSKFADDRPILAISFYASKSPAYRAQALRRRVGDKITLVANANSGMGISADFFIESINHRWSNGNTLWETTWELSPA